ncbi:MAG: fibronectin type III domain-containing protein [Deltaproteobacteria bacterium]|nr:fibronectin type III domain-containing protein [Deltaproteobacteria bacterium]
MRRALVVGLLLCAKPTFAAPSGVKLSWVSADASSSMGISWVTPGDVASVVQYGVASVAEREKTGAAALLQGVGYVHEVELTGLSPNTVYKYRVGTDGDWSSEYTFQTAPNGGCTPYSFVVLGDARSQAEQGPSPNWQPIHEEIKPLNPRFVLNTGDLVKDGAMIDQWAAWLVASESANPTIPMLPAIGNHDDGPGDGNSANYNRLFMLPPNSVTGTEDYWYIVYDNLVIFSLSTQTFDDFAAQSGWLESVAAQHPGKWKLAFFHHPVFTTNSIASHPPNEMGQNPHYGPAFDRAGIDVVVQGHNHMYERFRPLRYDGSHPDEGTEVAQFGTGPNDGRLYVTSGGAGSFLNVLIEHALQPATGSEIRLANYHFIKVSVASTTLHLTAIRSAISPRGGAGVMDEVTLSRPGPDPCSQMGDPDGDADGFPRSRDCDDLDPDVNPGAVEVCGNTIDEDCLGGANACPPPPVDDDADGSPAVGDCDDHDARRFPENTEVDCNSIDDDCDCLESCGGATTSVCGAPDAGAQVSDAQVPDTTEAAEVGAPDAISNAPDATAAADAGDGIDAGAPRAADSCSCRTGPFDESSGRGQGVVILAILLGLRRRLRVSFASASRTR